VLEYFVIPKIINQKNKKKGKNIRIWSCACASGQEPYSIAMILENHKMAKKDSFNYQIFATDIDSKQIKNAEKGVYTDQVLKNVPLKDIQHWFTVQENQYTISESLKEKITFSQFDLLDPIQTVPPDSIFGGFDIIMCANLLFYFNEDSRNTILKKLINSSNKDCFFITGEVERDYFLKQNFIEVYPNSSIFQISNFLKS
jgi:chemotaxis methyl-accepting protein methylase